MISLVLNFESRNYHGPTLLRITLTIIALLRFHTSFGIFLHSGKEDIGILMVSALSNAQIALGDNGHLNNNNTCDY